jgi:hypothetical protein
MNILLDAMEKKTVILQTSLIGLGIARVKKLCMQV